MKIARPATLITVALMALSLGVVGCRKDLQKPTTLQGRGPGRGIAGEQPGGIIGSTPVPSDRGTAIPETPAGTTLGDPSQGLKAAVGDWDKWSENPNEFKDQTVYFDFDKSNVKPSEVGKLKEVARRMKTFKDKALRIDGHCDERGTEEYNRALGDRRAQSIREFLTSEGIDQNIMPTRTYGEDKPADPGHNEAAYAKNRRGELILLSPTGSN
ncbi:MAG TPA: OmpA family protein [Verrucomicrobiae bacterium]|nr:OmpA family protein [Verrucomicrobiae bacterium]